MRALVIGAGGFVGRHLVAHLRERGDEVYCGLLSLDEGSDAYDLFTDITEPESLRRAFEQSNPDTVYLLAGMAFVPEAEKDLQGAIQVNVLGVANVAKICAEVLPTEGALVFASSAEVYGAISDADLPIDESTPVKPGNNYSLSKCMGELALERYLNDSHRVRRIVVRPFNHIGVGQDSRFVSANFARQLALIAHGLADPILKVGNLEARRDFSDVRDVVRAYRLLAERARGVFNVGSGESVSISSILDSLIKISGLTVRVDQDESRMRPSEVPEIYGSYEKIRQTCGWMPQITLLDTLGTVYQYWYDTIAAQKSNSTI